METQFAARLGACSRSPARRRSCASPSRALTSARPSENSSAFARARRLSLESSPRSQSSPGSREDTATGAVDMLGEIKTNDRGALFFQRGVTEYPMIGDVADMVTQADLKLIFDMSGPGTIDIGTLQQDPSIHAYINVDDMVRKHFAVFGTTGVGKSTGVAVLLRQILDARPDLRVFLIDPHNEYGQSFDDRAQTLSPKNLKLPFWLFNFEEIVDVFFRGRPGVDEEVEILSELLDQVQE